MAIKTVKKDDGLEEITLKDRSEMDKKKGKEKEKKQDKKSKKESKKTAKKQSYLRGVVEEMKLVTWPSRKNVVKLSVASITMIVLLAAFFIGITALFDLLYAFVQGWIG